MTKENKKQEFEKEKIEQVSEKVDNKTDKPFYKKDEELVNNKKITETSGEAIEKLSAGKEKDAKKEKTIDDKQHTQKSKELTDKKISEPKGEAKPKADKKKPVKPVVKKSEAVVNATNIPISTKYSIAICKFIKNKKIEKAIDDLEQVLMHKKAIPMKGEIPHRKGKGIMSGRYPKKATEHFIKLLKSLLANANNHEVNNPVIAEAISNQASRPFGRFGRIKRKRTHVRIVAREKKLISKNKKPKEKKKTWKKET